MTFDTEDAALAGGRELFAPGTRWRKSFGERVFVVELHDGGTLAEWEEGVPDETWAGTWALSAKWDTPFYVIGLKLVIGDYESRFRAPGAPPYRGYEIGPGGWQRVPPEDRRHEYLYRPHFPVVHLSPA